MRRKASPVAEGSAQLPFNSLKLASTPYASPVQMDRPVRVSLNWAFSSMGQSHVRMLQQSVQSMCKCRWQIRLCLGFGKCKL